jgi:hypothetical protein
MATGVRSQNHSDAMRRLWRSFVRRNSTNAFLRTSLLIHLPIEEEDEDRWCLWRPDHAGFDSRSIFEGALVEE